MTRAKITPRHVARGVELVEAREAAVNHGYGAVMSLAEYARQTGVSVVVLRRRVREARCAKESS